MFIDTSAIVALLTGEAEAEAIAQTLARAARRTTSPLVRLEVAAVVATRLDISPSQAEKLFDQLIMEAEITIEPITDAIGKEAVRCFEIYGKGRHPARLNIVDCFSYACASTRQEPLLFKGEDFTQTDVNSPIGDPQ